MRQGAWLVAALAAACTCGTAQAAPLQAALTASNGEGTFDDTIACPGGDGPSWRYAYSGATTPVQGPIGGTWTSTVDVHDAGGGAAFVPAGGGRVVLTVDRGGAGFLEFGQGGCSDAAVTLSTDANGEPVASGTLPLAAVGGSGTLRGLSGAGTAGFTLGLGSGADNAASLSLSGSFSVRAPNLQVGTPRAFWRNASDYLSRRISVSIPINNAGSPAVAGDAYAVRVASATLTGAGPASGVPVTLGRLDAGAGKTATVAFSNAGANRTYTLTVRLEATDALDGALPAVTQSRAVTTPLLP